MGAGLRGLTVGGKRRVAIAAGIEATSGSSAFLGAVPHSSAVEDAGLGGRWQGGRKPGGASPRAPGTETLGGASALKDARLCFGPPRGICSRKLAARCAKGWRPVGDLGPRARAGAAALRPPRSCPAVLAPLLGSPLSPWVRRGSGGPRLG